MREEIPEETLQNVSEILNSIAHPLRLRIVLYLYQNPASVTDMLYALKVRQPNLSQHLALLKRLRILKTKREGRKIYYSLAFPEIRDYILNTIEFFKKLQPRL